MSARHRVGDWRLRRFFVNKVETEDDPFIITGHEARHMVNVLRMGKGDRLILMDGTGNRYEAMIISVSSHEVSVRLERALPKPPTSPLEIILCQAMLKSGPMDLVIQKTSELGVDRLIPFFSERTVVRPEKERSHHKRDRWQEIAVSAAKQSDRVIPEQIDLPSPFGDLMERLKLEMAWKVILWEGERAFDLKSLIDRSLLPQRIIGIIGPEGGFTEKEVTMAREAGFSPVSLGRRILRAETAALALATILQYTWGDLRIESEEGDAI